MWTIALVMACGSEVTDKPTPPDIPAPTGTTPPVTTPEPAPTDPTSTPTTPVDLGALDFVDGDMPSNLLVISLDTTRRDHIGRFSGTGLTPNLDRILSESVALDDHHSCSSWTAPSMTCVVTGRTQMEHGFATWNDDDKVPNYPNDQFVKDTLPTQMSDLGKETLLITANRVFGPWSTRVAVGFDTAINVDSQPAADVAATAMKEIPPLMARGDWYAHVHFMDPHGSYCAPEEYVELDLLQGAGLSADDWCADTYGPGYSYGYLEPAAQAAMLSAYLALYDGEIAYWDEQFGIFWEQLDTVGALDDTLVVFVTDHGQQFFERGQHGHGIYLGAEENRSTAAFWAENLTPRAWSEPTIHQDVNATINAVFGITPVEERSGLVVGTAPPERPLRIINFWGGGSPVELGVIRDREQLNYDYFGNRALFRMDDDPTGTVDVYDAADPDVVALWTEMDAWIAEVGAQWPHLKPTAPGP